ncbi:MAG: site-2 protease family protein [Desulfovibrionaceae bacterium]|nr:site-2 protease family protein [Desulfovibrionaceae bacterium]MBF0513361.1 site-2 protease family protein [Desulfovibrionaceae bacterium]
MFDSLGDYVRQIVILAPPLLFSITCHEVAHGYVAALLGDPTARLAGRLTLNPLKHLDPVGVLAFLATRMIGWAKPVPVDPRYFKNPPKGMMLVSVAGPLTNFLLAIVFLFVFRGLYGFLGSGGHAGSVEAVLYPVALMCKQGIGLNVALAIFNLLPLPPLDGSQILAGVLPRNMAAAYLGLSRYGFVVLILLAVTGWLGEILRPAMVWVLNLMLVVFWHT